MDSADAMNKSWVSCISLRPLRLCGEIFRGIGRFMDIRTTLGRVFFVLWGIAAAGSARALECGAYAFPFCANAEARPEQFAGGFAPPAGWGGHGGFGGGDCRGTVGRVPVVMIHGNGDSAIGWDAPARPGAGAGEAPSVYRALRNAGYNDCELFGPTYLSPAERADAAGNLHRPEKYDAIWRFIQAVREHTGSAQVDIVAHSLGVSMAIAALDHATEAGGENAWASVRRFVNIAGGLHGLNSCLWAPVPACRGEASGGGAAWYEFGFYPDMPPWVRNRWTAVAGDHSLRQAPARHPDVLFYSITAGRRDDIHCPRALAALPAFVDCVRGPLFSRATNVKAQLDLGADPPVTPPPWTGAVSDRMRAEFPRDLGGIGHFGARNVAGPVVVRMLESDCRGTGCRGGYRGRVRTATP